MNALSASAVLCAALLSGAGGHAEHKLALRGTAPGRSVSLGSSMQELRKAFPPRKNAVYSSGLVLSNLDGRAWRWTDQRTVTVEAVMRKDHVRCIAVGYTTTDIEARLRTELKFAKQTPLVREGQGVKIYIIARAGVAEILFKSMDNLLIVLGDKNDLVKTGYLPASWGR